MSPSLITRSVQQAWSSVSWGGDEAEGALEDDAESLAEQQQRTPGEALADDDEIRCEAGKVLLWKSVSHIHARAAADSCSEVCRV